MWNANKANSDGRLRHIRRDGGNSAGNARDGRDRQTSGLYNAGYYSTTVRRPLGGDGVSGVGGLGGGLGSSRIGGVGGAVGFGDGMAGKRGMTSRVAVGSGIGGSANPTPSGFMWSRYDTFGNDDNRDSNNNESRDIFGSGDMGDNAMYSNRRNDSRSQPISSTFLMDDQDPDFLDEQHVLGMPAFLSKMLHFLWRRRPRSFGGVAVLGILMAFALAFWADYSKQRAYYNDGSSGLFGAAHLPRALVDSVIDTASTIPGVSSVVKPRGEGAISSGGGHDDGSGPRPDFVYEHPYVSSSYYTSTKSLQTLWSTDKLQVQPKLLVGKDIDGEGSGEREIQTRLAIVRPFCEFDAEALPTTFACWNALPPCKAASDDIGDEDDYEYELGPNGEFVAYKNSTAGRELYENFGEHHFFDQVGSDAMKSATADVFLFYSQTFSENEVAIKAVDTIIDQFFEPGGWSQCFDNIYAIEANIPQELDLYIPSAQEELYNWVNGPNRQFEAAFRIIQSGEWGDYDGFYLMEGDSVPIKAHWLDVVLSEIEVNRPFAILGAQYDGDKWDNFYEKIPISLLHHTNGNAIYNTSHPLLERLVGQLEVEAPCPYNSIPYDYRMSQMWVEGTLGIVPKLAPKIMLNEEGENITLSNNTDMFLKWAEIWQEEDPFKYTPVIHNYAATNLIPRHLGPEYIIHGAKLYSPWDPTKTEVTLVVSEWFFDRSLHLIKYLDDKDHPFSEVVVMVPPAAITHDDYDLMTEVPVRTQHRGAPDFMDLCEADIKTEWFMITNSYHHVARHVDLMFTPGTFKPVIPFTPATYAFCFKYPYCKETINLAQRFNPGHDKVVQDMDMLYNTEMRNAFCKEWKEQNGEEGEDMYKNQQRRLMFRKKIIGPPGPTGTSYYAWLVREGKDGIYKLTDRSLYGARPPFVKIFGREEKLDGMSEDELAKRVGMTLLDNSTDCNCMTFETEVDCVESGIGCIWRPLFESCHPPELVDGDAPICPTTEAPTSAPTVSIDGMFDETEGPTAAPIEPLPETDPWYVNLFKSRESEQDATNSLNADGTVDLTLLGDDDDAVLEPDLPVRARRMESEADSDVPIDLVQGESRKLDLLTTDSFYERDRLSGPQLDALGGSRRVMNDPNKDMLSDLSLSNQSRKLDLLSTDSFYEDNRMLSNQSDLSDPSRSHQIEYFTELPQEDSVQDLTFLEIDDGAVSAAKQNTPSRSIIKANMDLLRDSSLDDSRNMGVEPSESPSEKIKLSSQEQSDMLPWSTKDSLNDFPRYEPDLDLASADSLFSSDTISNQLDLSDATQTPEVSESKVYMDLLSGLRADSRNPDMASFDTLYESHDKVTSHDTLKDSRYRALGTSDTSPNTKELDISWNQKSNKTNLSSEEMRHLLQEMNFTSASAETRPRKLISENAYFSFTEFPINLQRYEMRKSQIFDGTRGIGLSTPINGNGQLPIFYRTILDYADKHPFEGATEVDGIFEPLRITFDTSDSSEKWVSGFDDLNAQVQAVLSSILPAVNKVWSEALSVVPVAGNLVLPSVGGIDGEKCGDAVIPEQYLTAGSPNTDVLIFVTTDGPFCRSGISSYAAVCRFDQHFRPVAGNLVICLRDIDAFDGVVSEGEVLRQISSYTLEVGKILGLSPSLFQFYRNPVTGAAWGSSPKTITCVDGSVDTLEVPNILSQGFDDIGDYSDDSNSDGAFFEVISPNVKQVVRNHFDCQTLTGARLSNRAASFSCFGETLDERFYFDEDMTSIGQSADSAFMLSPLSLALLEDSSWYKADYSKATLPLFGRGAGCGFVHGDCIVDGRVPDFGKGFFCENRMVQGCDYTHLHKASCDLDEADSDTFGFPLERLKHCPMNTQNVVSCSVESDAPSLAWESFGPNSRCFETLHSDSVCLKSFCNFTASRVEIIHKDKIFHCDFDHQVLVVEDTQVKCPRLAVVCPDLSCPASCSGKGVCDYNQDVPKCICDDPFDETPGCWSGVG